MDEGRWVAVYTSLLSDNHELHPAHSGEPACRAFAWIDLLGQANWCDGGGLKRGELRASVRSLARRWNWSRSAAHRFLNELEEDGRIARKPAVGRKAGRISICNYDDYQFSRDATRDGDRAWDANGYANRDARSGNPETRGSAPEQEELRIRGTQDDERLGHSLGHERDTLIQADEHITAPPSVVASQRESTPSVGSDGSVSNRHANGRPDPAVSHLPLPPAVISDLPDELYQLAEASEEPTPSALTGAMTGAWLSRIPKRPSPRHISKQGKAAKRLSADYGLEEVCLAWVGMSWLFPHSDGEPWDIMTLEKKFPRAIEALRKHPEIMQAERRAELERALDDV